MRKFSNNKDINKLIKQLIQNEICVAIPGSKHRKLLFKNGHIVTIPSSPSCKRAFQNFSHDIQHQLEKISRQGQLYE